MKDREKKLKGFCEKDEDDTGNDKSRSDIKLTERDDNLSSKHHDTEMDGSNNCSCQNTCKCNLKCYSSLEKHWIWKVSWNVINS